MITRVIASQSMGWTVSGGGECQYSIEKEGNSQDFKLFFVLLENCDCGDLIDTFNYGS